MKKAMRRRIMETSHALDWQAKARTEYPALAGGLASRRPARAARHMTNL
jgi:hypothetical protein